MKYILVICIFSFFSSAQEFNFNYSFGVPTNTFSKYEKHQTNPALKNITNYHSPIKSYGENRLQLTYGHTIWKKVNLLANAKVNYCNSSYGLIIQDYRRINVGIEYFNRNKIELSLGLVKRFEIYSKKLWIDLGLNLTTRKYLNEDQEITAETVATLPKNTSYSFIVQLEDDYQKMSSPTISNIMHHKNIYFDFSLRFNFKCYRRLKITAELGYSRYHVFQYKYRYTTTSITTDVNSGQQTINIFNVGNTSTPFFNSISNNYLNLGIGLTYNLRKNE